MQASKETGRKIAERRKAAGLTQKTLSEQSGVSMSTIQDWEKGARIPRDVYLLRKIARATGCAIEELIPDQDPE